MATIELTRVFRLGAVDLPDLDASASPDAVLKQYAKTYPHLVGGHALDEGIIGDTHFWRMKPNDYASNG